MFFLSEENEEKQERYDKRRNHAIWGKWKQTCLKFKKGIMKLDWDQDNAYLVY